MTLKQSSNTLLLLLATLNFLAHGWTPERGPRMKPAASSNKKLLKGYQDETSSSSAWGFSDTGGYGMLWGVPDRDQHPILGRKQQESKPTTHRNSVTLSCSPESYYFDSMGGEASCWDMNWIHQQLTVSYLSLWPAHDLHFTLTVPRIIMNTSYFSNIFA